MIVRWLGAYGHGMSLADSLAWELTQGKREVAAERFTRGCGFAARRYNGNFAARVGLRVAKGALVKRYPGDVYSVAREDGTLAPTRYASGPLTRTGRHEECFCQPVFDAIICREHPARMGKGVDAVLRQAAARFGLPVLVLDMRGKHTRLY